MIIDRASYGNKDDKRLMNQQDQRAHCLIRTKMKSSADVNEMKNTCAVVG
eukprot:m.73980 g.73980  ORF g.73980 m.73980 type:complete len:50 (+) comp13921_c0_seq1:803-952(+)